MKGTRSLIVNPIPHPEQPAPLFAILITTTQALQVHEQCYVEFYNLKYMCVTAIVCIIIPICISYWISPKGRRESSPFQYL